MAGPLRGERNACPNLKPPRPRNSWILYRRDQLRLLPRGQLTQADVSQLISKMWREAPEHVHAEYERRAEEEKAEHKRLFPDYRYRPMKKEVKERMKEAKKKSKELERQEKNPRRRTQKIANVSSSSPAPVSQITTSFVDPPHLRYGPAGPTPPLSVASSPSDASSSPVPPSGMNIPNPASSSALPVAPDLTSMPAAIAPLVQQPYSLVPEQSLTMPQPIHHVPQWQLSQNDEVQAIYDPWANSALTQPSDASVSSYLFHLYHHLPNIVATRTMYSLTCHKLPSIICKLGSNNLVMFIWRKASKPCYRQLEILLFINFIISTLMLSPPIPMPNLKYPLETYFLLSTIWIPYSRILLYSRQRAKALQTIIFLIPTILTWMHLMWTTFSTTIPRLLPRTRFLTLRRPRCWLRRLSKLDPPVFQHHTFPQLAPLFPLIDALVPVGRVLFTLWTRRSTIALLELLKFLLDDIRCPSFVLFF